MPAKLVFCPRKIKSHIKQLEDKYGKDILTRSSNLYFYCFTEPHSSAICELVDELKANNLNVQFPLAKPGLTREWGMIYVYLLHYMLTEKRENLFSWEDIVFTIQLSFVTGFLCDQRTSSILKFMANSESWSKTTENNTLGIFRKQFEFAMRHSLVYDEKSKKPRSEMQNQVVKQLIYKRNNFIQKYLKDEKVKFSTDIFIKHSLEVSVVGYDTRPLPHLKKLISGH